MADILLMNLNDKRIDNTLWDKPIGHVKRPSDHIWSFSYANIKPLVVKIDEIKDKEKYVEEDFDRE